MKKEIKICLPFYKLSYSLFFVCVLSVIRGVAFTDEIGLALEPMMALLAAVFCADTYVQEITSKRWEVERLYPMKNRIFSMFQRIALQEFYLLFLAAAGYGLFFMIQRPIPLFMEKPYGWGLFGSYMAAIAVTLVFWGMLSHTISCLFRTMWAGISGCLVLWVFTNSRAGDKIFGKWNVFSYAFRDIENRGDFGWLWGKLVCTALCLVMAGILPGIIRKRG